MVIGLRKLRKWVAISLTVMAATGLTTVTAARDRAQGQPIVVVETVPMWWPYVDAVEEKLADHDVPGALSAWREAHAAALATHGWEGMLEVGRAYLRIGDAVEFRRAFVPRAREHYLGALLRAREIGSLDGVLSAGEAFATLGDLGVVRQAVGIAASIMSRNSDARAVERLDALSRWTREQMVAAVQR